MYLLQEVPRGQEERQRGLELRILLHGAHIGQFYGMESRRYDHEHIFPTCCKHLVADFKKGIKQDPSLFPSLKHIDNWPTFKRETMAQAFAQDVVNVFNPKYKPRGSEEKDLFTLQLYYVYAIFCSNLKTDFGQKLVRNYESSQNAQAIWKELSNDAERSTVAQLNATNLLQYIRVHDLAIVAKNSDICAKILHFPSFFFLF